ncbi:hypothetical protein K1X84_12535 [bacterium]|nr:hypothetical protein [bacterium]
MKRLLLFLVIIAAGCETSSSPVIPDLESADWSTLIEPLWILDMVDDGTLIWAGTNSGLIRINKSTKDTMAYTPTNSPIPSYSINSIAKGDSGFLWIGTGNGLVKTNFDSWNIFNSVNSDLPSNSIAHLTYTPDGTLWMVSGNKLVTLKSTGFENFNATGLPAQGITTVALKNKNDIWVGTWGGGAAHYNGSKWTVYTQNNSYLRTSFIFDIRIDGDLVWIGEGGGLNRIDGKLWSYYTAANSELPQNDVTVIAAGNDIQWLGTYEGGFALFNGKRWKIFNYDNSILPSLYITSFLITKKQQWVGTRHGLVVIE